MASPSGSPAGTPAASPARSNSPPPPRSQPATPAPRGARGTPRGSPAPSALSASPVFARTPSINASPKSNASPRSTAPAGSPAPSPVASTPRRAAPGTPGGRRTHRGFLGSMPADSSPGSGNPSPGRTGSPYTPGDGAGLDEGSFIYGTNINDTQITNEFHKFIKEFCVVDDPHNPTRPFYMNQLQRLGEDASAIINGMKYPISGKHVNAFSKTLYVNLINFPTEVIPIFDRELWQIAVRELQRDPEELPECQVKVHDLEKADEKIMRLMNPTTDIERLVSVKGIVIRVSDLCPDMQAGLFQCSECKHEVQVQLSHWTIDEPTRCESCSKSHTFQLIHNDCRFGDLQRLKLQETPDLVPEGETPQSVVIHAFDDVVDQVRPGDRVDVTGIYRASAVRPMRNFAKCSSVYRVHIDAIAITSEEKGRIDAPPDNRELGGENAIISIAEKPDLDPEHNSEEDIMWNKKIRELAAERDSEGKAAVIQKLVNSFAPSIYEEEGVKKGLLCQLFGGTPKAASTYSKGKPRPEINSLLCGDPSTAKSQLMMYAYKLAPRAVITSGKGSSAVGLTASINTDPVTKDLVLESGALVLADRGMCCIDEFDKMDENARAILHEAMEQQTVSVAKAGIVCSLNARTAILASANPKDSSYDPKKSVADNINLPKNLMTRFDLIWLMLDKRNADMDKLLADHLVSMYSESGAKKKREVDIEPDLFRRYVSFARHWVFPRITDASSEKLVEAYTDLRNQGSSREAITATPRILESLIRIAESVAKMELREEVSVDDVAEAVRLIKIATYAAAIDPETGLIDMEQLIAGVGAGRRRRGNEMVSLLEEVVSEKAGDGGVSIDSLKADINERLGAKKEQLMREDEFNAAVRRLEEEGRISRKGGKIVLR